VDKHLFDILLDPERLFVFTWEGWWEESQWCNLLASAGGSMAAIAYPRTNGETDWEIRPLGPSWGDDGPLPALRLVPDYVPRSRRRPASARRYRRRRLVAGLVIATLLLAAGALIGRLGGGPLTAPEPAPASAAAPAPRLVHVVQPGDTLWVIARALQPSGDVRPLVQRLESSRQGQPLRVGETITLP
jgi:hypothetical protein